MLLACVLFAAKLIMLAVLALNTRFVMDEFWQFGQSKYLDGAFYDTVWPVKAVGYAIIYWPAHALGPGGAETLLLGRVEAVGLVILTLATLFAIARALGQTPFQALWSLIVLLSFSTYMERSFRLRAETPAIFFAALALFVLVRAGTLPGKRAILIGGGLGGLSFLCTQKAIYFDVALGLGLCGAMLRDAGLGSAVRAGVLLLLGWAVAVLVYALAFGGTDAPAVLRQVFIGPANLAIHGGSFYENLGGFILQTLVRNAALYAACFVGLGIAIASWRHLNAAGLITAVFTLVLAALVFHHNQPWPYIFTMILPFLSLWLPPLWSRLATRRQRRWLGLVVVLIVFSSFYRNLFYLDHDNRDQLEVVRVAETLLGPEGRYFDGIGMLPDHFDTPRRWLDEQGIAQVASGRDDLISALGAAPPDLIIQTSRTDRLPPAFAQWIAPRYVAAAPGLLVPGTDTTPGKTVSFTVVRKSPFDVYGPVLLPLIEIDGLRTALPVTLNPGLHTIAWPSDTPPARLMPEGLSLPERPAAREPLFLDVYTR